MDIIIETPKGSEIKYKYDESHRLFRLRKILPAGMVFPFDFGFIPGTRGEDGDPLDVLVLSELGGTFPGCIVDCRIVGCIQAKQTNKGVTVRNDRFLAVPEQSAMFENAISIEDIPTTVIKEIESFFVNYLSEEEKEVDFLDELNATQAMALLHPHVPS